MAHFKQLTTIQDVDAHITGHTLSFLYISQPNCSVCVGLEPQIIDMMQKYPDIQTGYISTQTLPEIAGHLSIFTVPVLLFFVQGKEYIREARIVHTKALDNKIARLYDNRQNLSII